MLLFKFGYPVEQIQDPVHRKAIETMIKTWGQTPKQIFYTSHPQTSQSFPFKKSGSFYLNSNNQNSTALTSNTNTIFESKSSIHRLVLNVKWGNYVGSLEQNVAPVCVWKESCKKNIMSLISLPSNDVIGLSQQKCLLLERAKETGFKLLSNADTLHMAVVEWGSYDDYIKVKVDVDKPSVNLLPIRSNEHVSYIKFKF